MHNSALVRPKPIDLFAPGGLDKLFERNRQLYGGWSMEKKTEDDDKGKGGGGGDGGGKSTEDDDKGKGGGGGDGNATDADGNDLGYPKDTPVAQMNDKQTAAYWRHYARQHEGRLKKIVGDKTPEEIQADLEEFAKIQREKQTPSEQAIAEAEERGKKAATNAERNKAATAIFRAALEAGGLEEADVDELAGNFTVANYITDDGIDTTKITNFAKRFTSAKENTKEKRRDFGGGKRRESGGEGRGSGGKTEAERRFGNKRNSAKNNDD